MVKVFSWIKKQLVYLKDSFLEIVKSIVFVFLTLSGLGVAILLRYYDQSGVLIGASAIIVQIIAFIGLYFLFHKYLKVEKESDTPKTLKK
ncbi:MAG: hypothetical protein ACFFAS_14785 [Promethearchaeota archaeon]